MPSTDGGEPAPFAGAEDPAAANAVHAIAAAIIRTFISLVYHVPPYPLVNAARGLGDYEQMRSAKASSSSGDVKWTMFLSDR